jgi:hypothetical protein
VPNLSIELIIEIYKRFISTLSKFFIIQVEEMVFCKPEFIIIKSNYFQNSQKGKCFLDDFAPMREIDVPALVLQNAPQLHSSARKSILRTSMRLRNVILKVVR